ncbi:uncharacterized protein LOC141902138 [Tubulanus polymorphus]|uniref:uncharacterized protein LOC141902138 n=1 Tax=Tubulanus polymorphus TaxID=672921 RepID=UPI003DA3248B
MSLLFLILISQFIAHLFLSGYSSPSIFSYISAISFYHKSARLPEKLLKGVANSIPSSPDARLPITIDILTRLVAAIPVVMGEGFDGILLKSRFVLCFHAFLRVGEISVKSSGHATKVLHKHQVTLFHGPNSTPMLRVCSTDYKHSDLIPKPLLLPKHSNPSVCLVTIISHYLHVSKHTSGPFFQFRDGAAVSYTSHRFRIGAATNAATNGVPEPVIRELGRCNSDAFKRYIRISPAGTGQH